VPPIIPASLLNWTRHPRATYAKMHHDARMHHGKRGIRAKTREGCKMSMVQEAEDLLARMTPAEKAQLLQKVIRDIGDAFPGIESRPGIQGGDPCIVRTRIPVWILEQARRLGVTEAELLQDYPSLRAEDLANAWAYVRAHRDEIDRQIREQESA